MHLTILWILREVWTLVERDLGETYVKIGYGDLKILRELVEESAFINFY